MNTLIRNASQVVTCTGRDLPKSGKLQGDVQVYSDCNLMIIDGKIAFRGSDTELTAFLRSYPADGFREISAKNKVILPGFVDAHTHFVFAGSRESEYEMRLAGMSYQEIAESGGGISSTVAALRNADEEQLLTASEKKLRNFFRYGTTTVEGKSGYGLDSVNELKMLRVLNRLKSDNMFGIDIVPTFLGAHSVPPGISKAEYVEIVCNEMIPSVAREGLAGFIDIFIEKGYFDTEDASAILSAGTEAGLKPRTHIDQFTSMGGTEASLRYGAVSLDHLEVMENEDIARLVIHNRAGKRKTLAGILPGVSYFLGIPYAPARTLIHAGVPVLLATDFNPGSSMTENMQMIMSLASTQLKMTAEEIISAVTVNAAYSLGLEAGIGSIEAGKQADLLIFDMPSYKYLIYNFGVNNLEYVIKRGNVYRINDIS